MTDDGTDGWKLRDFRVRKCPSGGFVVLEDYREMNMASSPLAAFSTADDLLKWLREQLMPASVVSPSVEKLLATIEDSRCRRGEYSPEAVEARRGK